MARQYLKLDTTYQVAALKLSTGIAAHRVLMDELPDANVRVTIDPNDCQLDKFGTPTGCTRMAEISYEGKLLLLDEREGEWLFSVEAPDAPALHVVLRDLGGTSEARLLVLDQRAIIKAVVALGHR